MSSTLNSSDKLGEPLRYHDPTHSTSLLLHLYIPPPPRPHIRDLSHRRAPFSTPLHSNPPRDTQQWPTPSLFPSSTSSWLAPSPVSPRSWSCTLWMSSRLACKPHWYSTVTRVRARAFSRWTASKRHGQPTDAMRKQSNPEPCPRTGRRPLQRHVGLHQEDREERGVWIFRDMPSIGTHETQN